MEQKKNILQSKTLWGAAGMFVLFLYVLFTGDAPPAVDPSVVPDVEPITDETGSIDTGKIWTALTGAVLWAVTNWGRFTANKKVTLTGK